MRRRTIVAALVAVLVAGGLFARSASPDAAAQTGQPAPKVDPRVLEDTANGQVGRFIVILADQASPRAAAAASPDRTGKAASVVTALRRTASASQGGVLGELAALGARATPFWIVNSVAVEGTRAAVDAMAARADVRTIEPDRAFRVPLEPPSTAPRSGAEAIWGVARIHAPDVWASGFTGQNVVVGIADTGVTWTHPALKPHYRGWNGAIADHNYNWWDPYAAPVEPFDDQGHGTHVTGIAAGDVDDLGNPIGVAPGARWIGCHNMQSGVGQPSKYIACLQFFLAPTDLNGQNPDPSRKADVVNNSYTCDPSEGCPAGSTLLQSTVDAMRAAGVFMAVAAGNSGSACSTVTQPPGIYDSSITAGATSSNDQIAGFSARGPVASDGSGRRKPDLAAPGVGVKSSYGGTGYTTLSGTSMASPHVAGAVALLWSALPGLRNDVDATEQLLLNSATPLYTTDGCGGDTGTSRPNNTFGWGLLDVRAAYQAAGGATATPTRTPTAGTATPTTTPTVTATATATSGAATPTATGTAAAGGLGNLTLVSPVRVVDTRPGFGPIGYTVAGATIPAAPLQPGTTTLFRLAGQTFGNAPIPGDIRGVLLNVTVVQDAATGGYLTVFPGDQNPPNASTVNPSTAVAASFWATGVPTAGPNAGTVAAYTTNRTDLILDLVGYYR